MDLTPDTFYTIALKLSGSEIMKMCSTDTKTRSICTSKKFNPVWIKKLYEEFGVKYEGDNAYMEYLQSSYIYRDEYWMVKIYDADLGEIRLLRLFKDRLDAVTFLANQAMEYHKEKKYIKPAKYICYVAALDSFGDYDDGYQRYEISKIKFAPNPQKERNNENYIRYMANLQNLYDALTRHGYKLDFELFKDDLQNIIYEEEYNKHTWERFEDEILKNISNFEDNIIPNEEAIKEIKGALTKLLDEKNFY